MTPLQTKHQIDAAIEQAKNLGFKLDIYNQIDIVATKAPYAKGAIIATLPTFEAVICFLNGYLQRRFEVQQLTRDKKEQSK